MQAAILSGNQTPFSTAQTMEFCLFLTISAWT